MYQKGMKFSHGQPEPLIRANDFCEFAAREQLAFLYFFFADDIFI
jgi:hypothetical protein